MLECVSATTIGPFPKARHLLQPGDDDIYLGHPTIVSGMLFLSFEGKIDFV